MTKTAQQKINRQLRVLRADRKPWLTGQHLHWGQPWCAGPGSPYCAGPGCEGCATVTWCRDRAAEIGEKIRRLQEMLAPAAQGALW